MKIFELLFGAGRPDYYLSPRLNKAAHDLPPGQFILLTSERTGREMVLLDFEDFKHVIELAGLRRKDLES